MARQPRLINVSETPRRLQFGDIVGVDHVARKQLLPALICSNNKGNPGVFDIAGAESPRMRAMFMHYNHDSQNDDKIVSMSVLLMSPTPIHTRIANTSHTLMINQIPDKKSMGVDHMLNWRMAYAPITIPFDAAQLGVEENSTVLKYGDMPPRMVDTVMSYIEKLQNDAYWASHGFLTKGQRRQLRGEQAQQTYDKITDATEARSRHSGGVRDARAVENIEERRAAEERQRQIEAKNAAKEAEKADLKKQKESPSGAVAFNKVKLRFNEQADPDISLENAHQAGLISEDDFIYLETIAPAMGANSLRSAYDAAFKHPVRAMSELVGQGICNEQEAIEFKKSLDARLKQGLVQFFDRSRQKNNDLGDKIIPFAPPREPEAP